MHQFERCARDAREGLRLRRQPSEDAGSALGGLVDEDRAPAFTRRYRFGENLALLDLEAEPDAVRQGVLQRGHPGF